MLSSSITPSTIHTFYDTALQELVATLGRITESYKELHPDTELRGRALEDAATDFFRLKNINAILDAITEKQADLADLASRIIAHTKFDPAIFVPPTPEEIYSVHPGSGKGMELKKIIPRLETLIYILEHDLDTPLEEVGEIVSGATMDSMMREHPYVRVLLPTHERIVYLCNEEGNATFVFSSDIVSDSLPLTTLDVTDKKTYKELIRQNPTQGTVIRYHANTWRDHMIHSLTEPFSPNVHTDEGIETKKSHQTQRRSDFETVPQKKDGWESASSLSLRDALPGGSKTIKEYVEQFRAGHPEWFERQKNKTKIGEHYHPDLVALIIEHFTAIPQKKDGWESRSLLQGMLFAGRESIKKFAEQFRTEHPEWFERQKNKTQTAEYYHPDLVTKITEHFTAIPQKRDGWESASSLSAMLSVASKTTKEYVEQFRAGHPEWFEVQKPNGRGGTAEHYHPELVEIIKQKFPMRTKGSNE